jgi:hypothetical protein
MRVCSILFLLLSRAKYFISKTNKNKRERKTEDEESKKISYFIFFCILKQNKKKLL